MKTDQIFYLDLWLSGMTALRVSKHRNYIFDCRYGLLGNKVACHVIIIIIIIIPPSGRNIMFLLSCLEIRLY